MGPGCIPDFKAMGTAPRLITSQSEAARLFMPITKKKMAPPNFEALGPAPHTSPMAPDWILNIQWAARSCDVSPVNPLAGGSWLATFNVMRDSFFSHPIGTGHRSGLATPERRRPSSVCKSAPDAPRSVQFACRRPSPAWFICILRRRRNCGAFFYVFFFHFFLGLLLPFFFTIPHHLRDHLS